MANGGMSLLQQVAERIVARQLVRMGRVDVQVVSAFSSFGGRGVDITYPWQNGRRQIKVKADPYFGLDRAKEADRSLFFYRPDMNSYAFEFVANSATREPGWIFGSDADEIYYYFLALGQAEDEVRALLAEPDEVLFSELKVERDDLRVLPMADTRRWFEAHADAYTPRPVVTGGAAAWYRLVPREDLEREVQVVDLGAVFGTLAR